MLSKDNYKWVVENMPILCVDLLVMYSGTVLLVRRKNDPLKHQWWPPGGRVLKGETLEEAVHRKAKEEIGIDVEIEGFVGVYDGHFDKSAHDCPTHTVSAVYQVRPLSFNVTLDDQSSESQWFEEIPPLFANKLIVT